MAHRQGIGRRRRTAHRGLRSPVYPSASTGLRRKSGNGAIGDVRNIHALNVHVCVAGRASATFGLTWCLYPPPGSGQKT